MDFSAVVLTEAQQAFAEEVRAFLDEHLTPEVYAGIRERADHYDEGFYLALGAKGWLMPRWRKEDGGAELDDVSRQDPRNRTARAGRADRRARHDPAGVAGGRGVTGTRGCATS